MAASDSQKRFGYVTILGEPNAGKSTLLNALMDSKLSIVTPKVQTTRFPVHGIYSEGAGQMILVDTPGLFQPKRRLDKAMVASAYKALGDADVIVFIFDLKKPLPENYIQEILAKAKKAKLLLLGNKLDKLSSEKLKEIGESIATKFPAAEFHALSALKKEHVQDFRLLLLRLLPPGEWHYPEDQLSTISERLLAAELTREQVFLHLSQELPYGIHVETEMWEDFKNGSVKISQALILARESFKPIVLGKGGAQIKSIRLEAQKEMEKFFGRKVHLFLHIKIRQDWEDNRSHYKDMGLDYLA